MDVRDVGLRGHADEEIADYAKTRNLIVLSADLGFANILRFPIGSHPGIAVARFPSEMPSEQVNQALVVALRTVTVEDLRGSVMIIEPGRVRLRKR